MDFKLGTMSERHQNQNAKTGEHPQAGQRSYQNRERKGIDIGEVFQSLELEDEFEYPRKYLKPAQGMEIARVLKPNTLSESTNFMKQEVGSGSTLPKFIPPGNIMNPRSKPEHNYGRTDVKDDISPEEASRLLESWRQSEYFGWDHWCKTARASFKLEIDPKPAVIDETPGHSSHPSQILGKYMLHFHRKGLRGDATAITGACIGRNHQDCRRDAIQKVFCKLQQLGLLRYGLIASGNYQFQIPVKVKQNTLKLGPTAKSENSLNKSLTCALNEHRFEAALEELRKTIPSKTDSWPEVFQIWTYGLLHSNMRQLRQTIDIMQYLKIKNDQFNTSLSLQREHSDSRIKTHLWQQLKRIYGFEMVGTDNNFDTLDPLGFETSVSDFEAGSPSFDNSSWLDCDLIAQLKVDPHNYEFKLKSFTDSLMNKHHDLGLTQARESKDTQNGLKPFEMSSLPLKGSSLQEKEIFYVDPVVFSKMYFSLVHSPNLGFAIEACENLHSRVEVDRSKMKGPYPHLSADYFMSRLNMLALDMLESVFKIYCSPSWQNKPRTILSGKVTQISYRNREQIFFFQPSQSDWSSKVLFATASTETVKDHKTWVRKNDRVANKDFVILVSLHKETSSKPGQSSSLDHPGKPQQTTNLHDGSEGGFHNSDSQYKWNTANHSFKDLLQDQEFISICCGSRTPRSLFVCQVDEITLKGTFIKLTTLCKKEEANASLKQPHDWVLIRTPVPGHHFRNAQSLCSFVMKPAAVPQVEYQMIGGSANTSQTGPVSFLETGQRHAPHLKKLSKVDENLLILSAIMTPPWKRLMRSPELQGVSPVVSKAAVDAIYQLLSPAGHATKLIEDKLKSTIQEGLVMVRCVDNSEKFELVHKLVERLQGLMPGKKKLISTQNPFEADAILEWIRRHSKIKVKRLIASQYEAECKHLDHTGLVGAMDSYYKNALSCHRGRLADELPEELIITTHETLASSYLKRDANFTFDAVIVFDAGSARETAVLSPLCKATRIAFLLGDQYATPPSTQSELAASKGIKISLFERLVKNGYPYFSWIHKPSTINPSIIKPFVKLFELGELRSDTDKEPISSELDVFSWPNPQLKVCFINTNSPEITMGNSLFNPREAELALNITLKLVEKGRVQPSKIAIVTPYTAQQKLIKACLSQSSKVSLI